MVLSMQHLMKLSKPEPHRQAECHCSRGGIPSFYLYCTTELTTLSIFYRRKARKYLMFTSTATAIVTAARSVNTNRTRGDNDKKFATNVARFKAVKNRIKTTDQRLLLLRHRPIFSASAISCSRKSGWAMLIRASARSQAVRPFRRATPYSVTR